MIHIQTCRKTLIHQIKTNISLRYKHSFEEGSYRNSLWEAKNTCLESQLGRVRNLKVTLRKEAEFEANLSADPVSAKAVGGVGAREMAQLIKCLPGQHEDLSWSPRTHVKKTDMVCHICS